MSNQEEYSEIFQKDEKKKKSIKAFTDNIAVEISGIIQKKVQQIKEKLNELIERKREILQSPLTKAETLEVTILALRENRRLYLDEFLIQHLKNCQIQNVDAPLSPRSFTLGLTGRDDYWKLMYGIIKEEDLKKAAEMLPDVGLSAAKRKAEIKKLDEEITLLESQIENELKKI